MKNRKNKNGKNKKRMKIIFLAKKLTMKNYLKNTHSLIGFSY